MKLRERQEKVLFNLFRNKLELEGFENVPVKTEKKDALINLFRETPGKWYNVHFIQTAIRTTRVADLVRKLKLKGFNIESRGPAEKREHRLVEQSV
jgi:hypothetical protein